MSESDAVVWLQQHLPFVVELPANADQADDVFHAAAAKAGIEKGELMNAFARLQCVKRVQASPDNPFRVTYELDEDDDD